MLNKNTEVFGLVLVCFWGCFCQKHPQKPKKLFFSAPECARTVLNALFECMHLAETCTYPFNGDHWFLKIPVYFRHILLNVKNVKNIPEFLVYSVYFGVLVTFLVSFANILDIWHQGKYTRQFSDVDNVNFWLSRNTEIFRQTHGLTD